MCVTCTASRTDLCIADFSSPTLYIPTHLPLKNCPRKLSGTISCDFFLACPVLSTVFVLLLFLSPTFSTVSVNWYYWNPPPPFPRPHHHLPLHAFRRLLGSELTAHLVKSRHYRQGLAMHQRRRLYNTLRNQGLAVVLGAPPHSSHALLAVRGGVGVGGGGGGGDTAEGIHRHIERGIRC